MKFGAKQSTKLHFNLKKDSGQSTFHYQYKSNCSVLGIFGPSGCGKTTLLEIIAGIRRPEGLCGQIELNGVTWLNTDKSIFVSAQKRGLGYVAQDHLLFPHRSVLANLEAGRRRAIALGDDCNRRLQQVIDVLQLRPLLGRFPSELSGGEKQRVALGRALCSGAEMLLLDEPLAALDEKLRYRILPFLQAIREQFKLPMIIVSHRPAELQALCDRVLIMERGQIISSGKPSSVFLKTNVYAAVDAEGAYENVLAVKVLKHGEKLTSLGLDEGNSEPILRVQRQKWVEGRRLFVRIAAHDILLATERLEHTSARNCLAATIVEIKHVSGKVCVLTELEGLGKAVQIAVDISEDAADELSLKSGQKVFLLIKSNSIFFCE